jgi:hypothetical protein
MRRVLRVLGILTCVACTKSDVTIAPPRVPQGGRAVAIAVSLSDEKRLVVGTESGGLFRTFNGGISFQHLDGFPTFAPIDVAIASLDPNTIIATARDDFRTSSGGGIWRSTDGGASWKRPTGWPPAASATCGSRPVARGISHMPLTRTFYVATDCGIAVSADNGATFTVNVLDPSAPTVRDVLVVNRTSGVAADNRRLWFLSGGSWEPASGGPTTGTEFAFHSLASPWWTGEPIFYHAGRDREVYLSSDGGATWDAMPTPPHGGGREKLVRVGRGLDGDPTHFDVYFGDGFTIWREAVTTGVPAGSNMWKRPTKIDHEDPADIAFTPGFERPLMLATDGGVHLTPDSGRTWTLTGSNYGGFTALQIGEMTGRAVGGSTPHLDLYYTTQDNDIKGSSDGGQTWMGSIAHEGAFLTADAANPAHADGKVTGRNCGPCTLFIVQAHLGSTATPTRFPSAPDGNVNNLAEPPAQLLGSTYLQEVPSRETPQSFDFFLTTDAGASWSTSFALAQQPVGPVRFAGNLHDPVTYISVKRPFGFFGLARVANVVTAPAVRRADSTGFVSLGVLRTAQAAYPVFAADPAAPDHLLAADAGANMMKASVDGGLTWFPLPALTAAVTDSGRFLFQANMSSFATTIAFDPANSCHILVGTMQNGVIRSADGGQTWARVAGSPVVTYVSSFFFPPTGAIWMSSYGRGLWTLSVDRRPPASGRCAFPQPPGTRPPVADPVVLMRGTRTPRPFGGVGDSAVCDRCTLVAVHDGWIADVRMDGDIVTDIVLRAGVPVATGRAGREVPVPVSNTFGEGDGAALRRLALTGLSDARQARGLVLREGRPVAVVMSGVELPLPAMPTPLLRLASAGRGTVPSTVLSGDSIAVAGSGFVPGPRGGGVDIVAGVDTLVRGVPVRADGSFSARLVAARGPGPLVLDALQRNGRRLLAARGDIIVVADER